MTDESDVVAPLQAADAATGARLPALVQPWATEITEGVYAVQLNDDVDWESVADWVGGEVKSVRDATDEYQAWIEIPRKTSWPQVAQEDWWVIRNQAGGRIVASPDFVSNSFAKAQQQVAAQPPTSEASPQ